MTKARAARFDLAGFERGSNISESYHQSHRLSRPCIETERDIELSRLLGNGVNDDSPDSDRIRCMCDAAGGISKQCPSQTPSLVVPIYRQTGEHHNGNRIWHVPSEPSRNRGLSDGARSEGIIADDGLPVADYVGPGGASRL